MYQVIIRQVVKTNEGVETIELVNESSPTLCDVGILIESHPGIHLLPVDISILGPFPYEL